MDFQFNEEQEELRAIARAFLEEHSNGEAVRAAMESELGYDPGIWKQIAAELGWASVHIPEEYGGLGLGYVELVALLEVMGEALLCSPFFSTVCMGANTILCAGSEEQKQAWLPAIAEGERTVTLAVAEAGGSWDPAEIQCLARRDGDGWRLSGEKCFVVDGHSADLLLIAAREEGSQGAQGLQIFAVEQESAGLSRQALPTMDQTRRLATLTLDSVRVEEGARLGAGSAETLEKALQLACIALAAEQVGGAQRILDLSVQYAKEREQFGRAIGSFQSIKHKCADMVVLVESARSAVYYGGCVAQEGGEELAQVAHLAKAYCSDAYFQCAGEGIQIHGGVGFTWEYDCHLYFKRAKSSESLLGDPAHHRERVAQLIGL